MSFHIDYEATLESIRVMRSQEENTYDVTDYLAELPAGPLHLAEAPVDAECRQVMAKWCIEICDFCHYSRETAAVSMSSLDRFMMTADGQRILLDRNLYQLAAMTALYSSVKIHENEAMDPALVSILSRNAHSAEAVENMEKRMLTAIQWRVNPPTAFAFVRSMFDFLPTHMMDASVRETVMELTNFQIELAICEYQFIEQSASHIALASVMNAVESISTDGLFLEHFGGAMSNALRLELASVRDLRIALYETVNGNEPMDISMPTTSEKQLEHASRHGGYNSSPRTINV